jgi:hypothetical protein
MKQLDHIDFPIMAYLEAGVNEDTQAVLIQIFTVEGSPIQFSLKLIDLERFLTYFLRLAANLRGGNPTEDRVQYQPIPISGMSAGELADGIGVSWCYRRHH